MMVTKNVQNQEVVRLQQQGITEAYVVNFNNNVLLNGNINLPQNRQSNNQNGNGLQSPTKGDYIKLKLLQSNIGLIKI
jgi:hypothetical protein